MVIEQKASVLGRPPISRSVTSIAAAIGLIAYTLLFSELFIRLVAPQPMFPRYVTGTPWGVRGNIPGAHYWHWSPDVNVEFRINRWGMRDDRDFPLEKPPGTCRIAVFGDSFFMGYEVDLKDSFSARLEARLRSSGINVEVLNFSVSGFGTAEMLRSYEGLGRKFNPDLVIFQWHSSDPDDNVRSDLYRIENGQLVPGSPTYLPSVEVQDVLMQSRVYRWVADHSQLYNLVRDRASRWAKSLLIAVNSFRIESGGVENAAQQGNETLDQYSVALSTALLRKSKQEIEQDGRDFVIVDILDRIAGTTFVSSFDILPSNLRNEFNVILPLDAFRAAASPERKLYYEHGQGHLTPEGVDILARVTAERVSKSPKFASCAAIGR
jgi:hypothetical protein